eukprot:5107688-Amphidinium_carterae.2
MSLGNVDVHVSLIGGGPKRVTDFDACNPLIFEHSSRMSALNIEIRGLRRAPMFMSCLCDIPVSLVLPTIAQHTRIAGARLSLYSDQEGSTLIAPSTLLQQGSTCCFYARVAPPVASRKKRSASGVGDVPPKRQRGLLALTASPPMSDGSSVDIHADCVVQEAGNLSPTLSFHLLVAAGVPCEAPLQDAGDVDMQDVQQDVQSKHCSSPVRLASSEGSVYVGVDITVESARRALEDRLHRVQQVRDLLDKWRHVRLKTRASRQASGVFHDEDRYHALLVPEVGKAASLRLLTLNVTSIQKHADEVWDLDPDVCVLSETSINELDGRLAAKSWRAVWGVPVGSQDRVADSHVAAHRGAIVLAKSPAVAASFPVPGCLQPWYFESLLTLAQVSHMGVDGSLLVIAVYASVSDAKDRGRMFAAIVDFLSGFQGDWVLAGDFQTVVCHDAALLQMVANAKACEPADFFMAPQDRITCGNLPSREGFPTHCAVVVDVLLGPSCACDALARGDSDDVFRFWSTRWEQWLVDLATAEEQHVCRTQRGRGLGSTKLSQAMKRAS